MYSQSPACGVPPPQEEIVTLPADAYPGKQYTFTAQSGQTVSFAVPAGMGPGSEVAVATGPQYAPQQQQLAQQQYAQQQYAQQYAQPQYVQQQYAQQQYAQPQYTTQQYAQQPPGQQYAASQASAAQRGSEAVTLPADAAPGKQYTFTSADGRSVTFSVPAGMGPGSVLTVSY